MTSLCVNTFSVPLGIEPVEGPCSIFKNLPNRCLRAAGAPASPGPATPAAALGMALPAPEGVLSWRGFGLCPCELLLLLLLGLLACPSSSVRCLFGSFAHFLNCATYYRVVRGFHMFWTQVFYCVRDLEVFYSPSLCLVFSLSSVFGSTGVCCTCS